LSRPRQRALFDALDAGDEPGARESTDRSQHSGKSERDDGAEKGGASTGRRPFVAPGAFYAVSGQRHREPRFLK
jgi:hypothetical protein